MVFRPVFRHVLQQLPKTPGAQSLYIGHPRYRFPATTTFRIPSLAATRGELPLPNRSIEYVFAQLLDLNCIPSPYLLQRELLRTCKSGLLVTRSPLVALSLDLPDDDDDLRFAVWTEADTNQLCFLPITLHTLGLLREMPMVRDEVEQWTNLTTFNPLYAFNFYCWEHPMELNFRVYPLRPSCPSQLEEYLACMPKWFLHGCQQAAQHTQGWVASLESHPDDSQRSP